MTKVDFGFSRVRAEEVGPGVDAAITEARQILDDVVAVEGDRTFENTMLPLDLINDVLAKAGTRFVFMGYVHPDKEVRAAGKAAEEKLGNFGVEMVFRDDLNAAVQEYAATDEAKSLEGERARFPSSPCATYARQGMSSIRRQGRGSRR
jgi:oligopeptidase A